MSDSRDLDRRDFEPYWRETVPFPDVPDGDPSPTPPDSIKGFPVKFALPKGYFTRWKSAILTDLSKARTNILLQLDFQGRNDPPLQQDVVYFDGHPSNRYPQHGYTEVRIWRSWDSTTWMAMRCHDNLSFSSWTTSGAGDRAIYRYESRWKNTDQPDARIVCAFSRSEDALKALPLHDW